MRPEPGWLELLLALLRARLRLAREGFEAVAGDRLDAADHQPWPAAARAQARLLQLSRWTRSPCLPRALALLAVAERRGIRGRLLLGAQREGGAVHAHAWVRFGGIEQGQASRGGRDYVAFPPPQRGPQP